MYGLNLWSPIMASSLGSCRTDVVPTVEDSFPKYSPFVLTPPLPSPQTSASQIPVCDSLGAVSSSSRPFFNQSFPMGLPPTIFCGLPFPPTSQASQESYLRAKETQPSSAFKLLSGVASEEQIRTSEQENLCPEKSECPVCHKLLDNVNLRLHFVEELEDLYKRDASLTPGETGSSDSPQVDTEDTQSTSSKSRYEHFLHIRNNRMKRLQGKSVGRKRKSPGLCPNSNPSPGDNSYDPFGERAGSEEAEKCSDGPDAIRDGHFSKFDFRLREEDVDVTENISDKYGMPQYSESDILGPASKRPRSEINHSKLSTSACVFCSNAYNKPLVSVQCWHVLCESCWLEVLRTKKLCPICKSISSAEMLRKIFM